MPPGPTKTTAAHSESLDRPRHGHLLPCHHPPSPPCASATAYVRRLSHPPPKRPPAAGAPGTPRRRPQLRSTRLQMAPACKHDSRACTLRALRHSRRACTLRLESRLPSTRCGPLACTPSLRHARSARGSAPPRACPLQPLLAHCPEVPTKSRRLPARSALNCVARAVSLAEMRY